MRAFTAQPSPARAVPALLQCIRSSPLASTAGPSRKAVGPTASVCNRKIDMRRLSLGRSSSTIRIQPKFVPDVCELPRIG